MALNRIFECITQVAAMMSSMGGLIAALVTEIKFKDLAHIQMRVIELASGLSKHNNLFLKTEVTAGLVFAAAGVVAMTLLVLACEWMLDIKRKNPSLKFLFLELLCFAAFLTAAVLGIHTCIDWSEVLSSNASGLIINGAGFASDVKTIRNSLAATSALALLAALLFGILDVLMICYRGVTLIQGQHYSTVL